MSFFRFLFLYFYNKINIIFEMEPSFSEPLSLCTWQAWERKKVRWPYFCRAVLCCAVSCRAVSCHVWVCMFETFVFFLSWTLALVHHTHLASYSLIHRHPAWFGLTESRLAHFEKAGSSLFGTLGCSFHASLDSIFSLVKTLTFLLQFWQFDAFSLSVFQSFSLSERSIRVLQYGLGKGSFSTGDTMDT